MEDETEIALTSARLNFSTITAPVWNELVTNRIAYAKWFICHNPLVYIGFRNLANTFRAKHPTAPFSVSLIFETLRFQTFVSTKGDIYCLNNNAKSLLARLYLREYPDAKLEVRKSWVELLSPSERAEIFDVWSAIHSGQGETA